MGFLPLMLNSDNNNVLIVGGGKIALRKLSYLLEFDFNIEVISQKYSDDMLILLQKYGIKYQQKSYKEKDIEKFSLVVVATNNINLQKSIYVEAKQFNILCNCVDSKEFSDFIFPAYIKDGDFVVSISTNGTSPSFAKEFKNYISTKIPKDVAIFLKEMQTFRELLPKGELRMSMCRDKVKKYIKSWGN